MKTKSQMEGRAGGGGGGEYFICFTARPSSSSASCAAVMRIPSSKSLMSPGRGGRDAAATAPPSLSASLSRRLRSSGSVKGLQSPMFPSGASAGGRRKGCAFEAAEPSSPKVTCIGQVRVKTKKKKRARSSSAAAIAAVPRSRSQRSVEASFRDHRALRSSGANWVQQIPVSICESLRALGDFNCFLPCSGRSFCSSSSSKEDADANRQKVSIEDKTTSSCGAVLARWLMSVHESEDGKRSEVVGLVVGDGCLEKSLAEELQEKKSMAVATPEDEEDDVSAARVSVCIPPKNALLLMRCRSDPVKMAALATRFWDSPAMRADHVVQDQNPAAVAAVDDYDDNGGGGEEDLTEKLSVQEEEYAVALVEESIASAASSATAAEKAVEEVHVEEEEKEGDDVVDDECVTNLSPAKFAENTDAVSKLVGEEEEEELLKGDNVAVEQDDPPLVEGVKEEADGNTARSPSSCCSSSAPSTSCRQKLDSSATVGGRSSSSILSKSRERSCMRRSLSTNAKERRRYSFSSEKEARRHSFSAYPEAAARRSSFSEDTATRRRWSFSVVKDEQQQKVAPPPEAETEEDEQSCTTESATKPTQANRDGGSEDVGDMRSPKLPDCLLLMMYEPKLSMEVSKETWVCSTDFLHWRPHQNNKENAMEKTMAEEHAQQQKSVDPLPPPVLPPLPAATVVTTAKVVPAPAMPPSVVLTRCKSEPMRASARLAPVDACFWKSRHQPIGAIGF